MEKVYKKVLKRLIDNGCDAYVVGGYVRDNFLGIYTDDIDITTSASTDEVISLFKKTIPTGVKHGTVTVIEDGQQFEITTFRSDGNYINHRHPETVEFVSSIDEDLKRRDFTINAFALDYHDRIIDLFNGKEDLNNKLLRSIGNPDKRFTEDALRMLRAIRFQSKLGFTIEVDTLSSIKRNQKLLEEVSIERIKSELDKLFLGEYYQVAIKSLLEINFDALNDLKGLSHEGELSVLERYTLCYYINGFDLKKWKFSNSEIKLIKKVSEGIDNLDRIDNLTVYNYGLDLLISNKINKIINGDDYSNKIKLIYNDLPIKSIKELKISGSDLTELGFNGPKVGDILKNIENKIVQEELANDLDEIIKYVRRS
ncbi:CCA tRNA nucleotidyltransferase [Mycoplasmatota bacterium WC44]